VTAAELDGRVTIDDAGLGKMASTKNHTLEVLCEKRSLSADIERC